MNKKIRELNQLNGILDDRVAPVNRDALTDIVCYLRSADISEYGQESVRHDLLEMVISAQERGETIGQVIGEDYKEFCNDIIASLPQKSRKQKVMEFGDIICFSLSILFSIAILMEAAGLLRGIISGQKPQFQMAVSAGDLISWAIILGAAYGIVQYITKNSFETGKGKPAGFKIIAGMLSLVCLFVVIAWLGKVTVFTVNIFAACALALLLYLVHKAISSMG